MWKKSEYDRYIFTAPKKPAAGGAGATAWREMFGLTLKHKADCACVRTRSDEVSSGKGGLEIVQRDFVGEVRDRKAHRNV